MGRKKKTIDSIIEVNAETLKGSVDSLIDKRKKIIDFDSDSTIMATASDGTTSLRRNVASTLIRSDRYTNIEQGIIPFVYSSNTLYGGNRSLISIRDAVILCQKCYYNFAIFRNIIDLMTEFSIGELYFRGGSGKSRDFFKALFNKINIWDFQDKFYREYYRSGNVFIYRFDAEVEQKDIKRITQVFGSNEDIQPDLKFEKMHIPARYIILNPADIHMVGAANFGFGMYYKLLTAFELTRLKNPQTEEDKMVFENFSPDIQKQIQNGIQSVLVPLDYKRVAMVFYKKQDYEPFSIPMGFPVLEDINFKAELKKIDMAISRTMQQIILLVKTGAKPEEGGINFKNIKALRDLFENLSVGRVLVSDYTTTAEFVIPDIGELLNPQKYEIVERDINIGLNNVFAGSEKFANQQQKVDLFIERLEQARLAFLNNFLVPEIKRIAQSLGFKNYPTPYFKAQGLKDSTNYARIYSRLMELGILTPEEGFDAIQNNVLPDKETMLDNQKTYKTERDSGLYQPLLNQKQQNENGRPSGINTKQTTKNIKPIGTKASLEEAEIHYSLSKITDNIILSQSLAKEVEKNLKEIHKLKKLNKAQKEIVDDLVTLIVSNEEPDNWIKTSKEYCEKPLDKNIDRVNKILEISEKHNLEKYISSILYASPKN